MSDGQPLSIPWNGPSGAGGATDLPFLERLDLRVAGLSGPAVAALVVIRWDDFRAGQFAVGLCAFEVRYDVATGWQHVALTALWSPVPSSTNLLPENPRRQPDPGPPQGQDAPPRSLPLLHQPALLLPL